MILHYILAGLAGLSAALMLWQWAVARRFPLHRRIEDKSFTPAVSLLKPMKGADEHTEACLRSWFEQNYTGPMEILFGAASPEDPSCAIIRKLMAEFPQRDARLIITSHNVGANGKASNLAQLEPHAKYDLIVSSDADVRVPNDFLSNAVAPLKDEKVGLVNCFYRLANPTTLAMHWEAIAVNADFWSSVLQSASLKPLDFALGAVMATRRKQLAEIGGFAALADCLADDYQLGNRIAKRGHRIELCPVVVACWSGKMGWRDVWRHQLRWARTIRVSQPVPYFFSILANAMLWPLLWLTWGAHRSSIHLFPGDGADFAMSACISSELVLVPVFLLLRLLMAWDLQRRLTPNSNFALLTSYFHLVWLKDLLQFALWLCAFAGNKVEWRGQWYRLRKDGTLERK